MTGRAIFGIIVLLLARGAVLACAASVLLPSGRGMYLNVVVVGVDIATICILAILARRQHTTLRRFVGTFVAPRDLPLAGVTMFALFLGLTGGTFIGNALAYGGPPSPAAAVSAPLWLGLWSLIAMPLTVAVAEELLYRGWAHQQLRTIWPPWVVITIIAVAFGLQHAALSATSVEAAAVRVVATGCAGALLGILRERNVSLWALMIGHWAFDVIGLGVPALTSGLTV